METIELMDGDDIICPYCQEILVDADEDDEYRICEHTIYVATNVGGFQYVHNDFKILGDLESNYDEYFEMMCDLQIEGTRYNVAPPGISQFWVYWGFRKNLTSNFTNE
jgi:hypothetical protein